MQRDHERVFPRVTIFQGIARSIAMTEVAELSWTQATDLTGKRVVVTGCASGIGRATAKQFAGAGGIVYGGDVNEKDGSAAVEEIKAAGGRAEFFALDLFKPA